MEGDASAVTYRRSKLIQHSETPVSWKMTRDSKPSRGLQRVVLVGDREYLFKYGPYTVTSVPLGPRSPSDNL